MKQLFGSLKRIPETSSAGGTARPVSLSKSSVPLHSPELSAGKKRESEAETAFEQNLPARDLLEGMLRDFYAVHDPSKVQNLDSIMAASYKNGRQWLQDGLARKYNGATLDFSSLAAPAEAQHSPLDLGVPLSQQDDEVVVYPNAAAALRSKGLGKYVKQLEERGIVAFEDLAKLEEDPTDPFWATMPPIPYKKQMLLLVQSVRDHISSVPMQQSASKTKSKAAIPIKAGSTGMKAFEDAIKSGGSAPWMRSKLMLVGEGRAGKSSLVRSLQSKHFDPNLESTLGADTSLTVTVDRLRLVDWEERSDEDEFAQMAARSAAQKIRNHPAGTVFSFEAESNPASNGRNTDTQTKSNSTPSQKKDSLNQAAPPARLPSAVPARALLPEEEIAKRFDETLVSDALAEEDDPEKRKLVLSIWDYGGQEVFYALHHVFLTRFGVYCVVFDMSLLVGSEVKDATREKCIGLLQFWLRSIYMHAHGAPIFLVGTHKDVVSSNADHRAINQILIDRLNVSTNAQLVPNYKPGSKSESLWFFPINNPAGAQGDEVIRDLRFRIIDSVKEEKYIQQAVPLTWIRILDLILQQSKTSSFLTLEKVEEIARCVGVVQKVRDMLRFFHELGVLSYFDSSPEVRRVVVLEPQWIVNAFTKVIRDMRYHPLDMMTDIELRTTYSNDVSELTGRGIVSKRLLYHLWAAETTESREFLLALMRNMSLVCDWVEQRGDNPQNANHFLVPSLFELDLGLCTMPKQVSKTKFKPVVFFDLCFDRFFLPRGLFPRLVALVVSHSVSVFDDGATPLITKTLALVSFGEADFSMDISIRPDAIRVGVLEAEHFETVRAVLVSMIDKLRDEIMGQALMMDVHLLVLGSDGDLIPVDFETAKKARADPNKPRFIRAVDGRTKVEWTSLETFFAPVELVARPLLPPAKKGGESYDFFISYYQGTGKDQVMTLAKSLESKGHSVWLDQLFENQITEEEMRKGVTSSKCVLVFLSKGYFTREFCLMELRLAKTMARPILFVHETDDDHPGFARIGELKAEAPNDLRSLFNQVESIAYRRRRHEADSMLAELERRFRKIFAS